MVSGVIDEVRTLFKRGEYETVVSRCEQLQHRNRGSRDDEDRLLLSAARAAALTQLGKMQLASSAVSDVSSIDNSHPAYPAVSLFTSYARPYLAWASNQSVSAALDDVSKLPAPEATDVQPLRAQLLYRLGRYGDAVDVYQSMFADAKNALDDAVKRSNPAQNKSWALSVRRITGPAQPPVSEAELEALRQTVNEIGTNLMASMVLAGRPSEALAVKPELGTMYEAEYNSGCASIAASDWPAAQHAMEEAERLYRAVIDEEEDDVDRGLAPILVQRAYLGHVAGDVESAERKYAEVLRGKKADAASLAVAANNAAVAAGQLAHRKQSAKSDKAYSRDGPSPTSPDGKSLKRDQNSALFDALKKMKATSGWDVERKLTFSQRRAMARNRAVLLVQMGRLEASRAEVDKLKTAFPDDPKVPLIEAALVAKTSSPADAMTLLQTREGQMSNVVNAARVKLTVDEGNPKKAAELLEELFPNRAAALATAAAILEEGGFVEEAISLLERICEGKSPMKDEARRALASSCLRASRYEQAATVLRELRAEQSGDNLALGQLIVATSYFEADEAERLSEGLPSLMAVSDVDAAALESKPPPRKRDVARSAKSKVPFSDGNGDETGASLETAKAKCKKKKKKKKRLPKNYDPNGPPPDPERWLPKTLRSTHKKKRKNREMNFRGAQGADAASADAAAARNAERSAARAAESAAESVRAPASNLPKGTKNKKKSRRR